MSITKVFGVLILLLIMGSLISLFISVDSLFTNVHSWRSPRSISLDVPDASLSAGGGVDVTPTPAPGPYNGVDIGFHESITGISPLPAPEYWYNAGRSASSRFDGAAIGAVWVIGCAEADGQCHLNFPSRASYPWVTFADLDQNEPYLDYFDSKGIRVILQVEPGQADVDTVLKLVLDQYSHHPCVIGAGVDVEWLQFKDHPSGRQVTDQEAERWYKLVASYNNGYTLALTHWETDRMPPAYRNGIYFLYDGYRFPSLNAMLTKCVWWGNKFPDNPVGFYIGFPDDRSWYGKYDDPYYTVAHSLLGKVKNTKGIYWVSNSIKDIFPV